MMKSTQYKPGDEGTAEMAEHMKFPHGTAMWFGMVGTVMKNAAIEANLPPDSNVCLVERYMGGVALSPGLLQGLRFSIQGGQPSFRVGVAPDELADITVEVTAAASHELNTLHSTDPRFGQAFERLKRTGELRVQGSLADLGEWFGYVHDSIVERTNK
jgi:hypothetical protein